jgi:hypothetical protein
VTSVEQDLAEWSRMGRQEVESTTMRSVGYDHTNQVLEVEFQSGAIDQYLDVRPAIHKELMDAASKGRYFNREIRDIYTSVRVDRQGRRGASSQ